MQVHSCVGADARFSLTTCDVAHLPETSPQSQEMKKNERNEKDVNDTRERRYDDENESEERGNYNYDIEDLVNKFIDINDE